MGFFENIRNSKYLEDLAERAGKTFVQFYLGYWLFLNPDTSIGASTKAFDTLFSTDNAKAGVVGLALSVVTSIGSRYTGSRDSASLVD